MVDQPGSILGVDDDLFLDVGPEGNTLDELITLIELQQGLLASVATGGPQINTVDGIYKERRRRIRRGIKELGIEDPFPWTGWRTRTQDFAVLRESLRPSPDERWGDRHACPNLLRIDRGTTDPRSHLARDVRPCPSGRPARSMRRSRNGRIF